MPWALNLHQKFSYRTNSGDAERNYMNLHPSWIQNVGFLKCIWQLIRYNRVIGIELNQLSPSSSHSLDQAENDFETDVSYL